jgi:hypothetical protein
MPNFIRVFLWLLIGAVFGHYSLFTGRSRRQRTGLIEAPWQRRGSEIRGAGPTIFDYFDNPRSARSNTDKMNTYRVEHSDLADIDLDLLVHTVNGVFAYNTGLGQDGVRIPPRDRGVYLKEPGNRQFARWLHSFKDAATNGCWVRPG